MKMVLRFGLLVLMVAAVSSSLSAGDKRRLTPLRLAALAAAKPAEEMPIAVEFSGFDLSGTSKITLIPGQGQMVLEKVREIRAPTDFKQPYTPEASGQDSFPVVPGTPTAFETIKAGWTIRLQARREAGVLVLSGVAEYVEVEFVNGNYGELAGPITAEDGAVISPNVHRLPLKQATTTRFNLSAIPGQSYEVMLFKGKKQETHTVKVTVP